MKSLKTKTVLWSHQLLSCMWKDYQRITNKTTYNMTIKICIVTIVINIFHTRGIICGTDKFHETRIHTVFHCLWNWQIVFGADKVGLRYYKPNKNSTLFMKVLLVGIEMVNTQTLTSQLKQIDHDMQKKYFN